MTTLLKDGEGQFVDYKLEPAGLAVDDLVAFANQADGGTILVGVREEESANGKQFGKPVGCAVDDATRLQILNKALSCHPPISVNVHIHTLADVSFLSVQVMGSDVRPHCTPRGTYLVRSGSRNAPMLPTQLLATFLDREAGEFERRFSRAAREISGSVDGIINAMAELQSDVRQRIEKVADELGWSDMMFDDTGDKIDQVQGIVADVLRRTVDSATRLREIAKKTGSPDPIKERASETARRSIKEALLENQEALRGAQTGSKLSASVSGEPAEELTRDELQVIFSEVISELLPGMTTEPADRTRKNDTQS